MRAMLRKTKARPDESVAQLGRIDLPSLEGALSRPSPRKAARGWYAPRQTPAPITTRQAEILNPALVGAPTDDEGVLQGRDVMSNLPVASDPFAAYERKQVTSPNVAVLGMIGSGKSSLLKTVYVLRPMVLRDRRCVVIDRKDQAGEGEYAVVARALGTTPFKLLLGGGPGSTRLNPLDPVILRGGGVPVQLRLLASMAEQAGEGQVLDKWERKALRIAHAATLRAAETAQRVPVLEDLIPNLGGLPADWRADYSTQAAERLHQAGLGVRFLLDAVGDELEGLFDGPTSEHVRLDSPLTVFDVSQLPEAGPAVPMAVAIANTWLMGELRHKRGLRTTFVAEEGWHLVEGAGGRLFRSNSKLSRGLGLSNVAALHHISDIPPGSPGEAMLREAQTVHIFRQERDDDIEATIRMFGLQRGSRETLANLAPGHYLLKIGNRRELYVEHVRSPLEKQITDTDAAMTGRCLPNLAAANHGAGQAQS